MRSLIGATDDEFYFILFRSNVLIWLPTATFFFIDTEQKWNDAGFCVQQVSPVKISKIPKFEKSCQMKVSDKTNNK